MTTLRPSTVLLDTSVQIDRRKMGTRADRINRELEGFETSVSTSFALLEFRQTLVQELITIHSQLRLKRRFTAARDALLEKNYRQSNLRAHIFNNLISFAASSFEITEEEDERMAEEARLLVENHIREAYRWFRYKSVDRFCSAINCNRAAEAPEKKRVTYASVPTCKRGLNKSCNVEQILREHVALVRQLRDRDDPNGQFAKSVDLAERVAADDNIDLSHRDCRSAGDCLIALEAKEDATHAMSTNASEWGPLCELVGLQLVRVTYPDEQTR